jgi:hypothetical protein
MVFSGKKDQEKTHAHFQPQGQIGKHFLPDRVYKGLKL